MCAYTVHQTAQEQSEDEPSETNMFPSTATHNRQKNMHETVPMPCSQLKNTIWEGGNKKEEKIKLNMHELLHLQEWSEDRQSAQFCIPAKASCSLNQRAITVPSLLNKWEQYPALIRESIWGSKWQAVIAKEVSVIQSLSLYLCKYLRGGGGGGINPGKGHKQQADMEGVNEDWVTMAVRLQSERLSCGDKSLSGCAIAVFVSV